MSLADNPCKRLRIEGVEKPAEETNLDMNQALFDPKKIPL